MSQIAMPLVAAAPFVGSFIGTVVLRSQNGCAFLWGRSRCDHCGFRLRPRDMVPLISWFCLRARCAQCQGNISVFYPGIEIASLLLVVWAVGMVGPIALLPTVFFSWLLLALSVIDLRCFRLPDHLTLLLLVSGLLSAFLLDNRNWFDHVLGAVVGFAFLAVVIVGYRSIRRSDGMGWGDAKMLAGLGAWVGWQGLPSVILIAALLGIVITILQSLFGQKMDLRMRIPFGPFLGASAWLIWLYGPLVPA